MKVLKIRLTQSSANYAKEDTIDNKLTYPLPPLSTVIGAIHTACKFKEYHPMNISIQGDYESVNKKIYNSNYFSNSLFDDRGTLVKMSNPNMLSKSYQIVGMSTGQSSSTLKCSFMKESKVKIANKSLLEEYKNYKEINDKKGLENFKTLNNTVRSYEILSDIELVLHIESDIDTLNTIKDNIYNLKSLGRSEDFVDVLDAEIIELTEPDKTYKSTYHAYIDTELTKDENDNSIILSSSDDNTRIRGTKYYLCKNYEIIDNKRVFKRKKVYYTSSYAVHKHSKGVWIDKSGDIPLIVNLL